VVPGFLNECFIHLASPFSDGLVFLERQGYRTGVIRVSAMSSSAHNARQIRDAIVPLSDGTGPDRAILVGHSKGAVDILEALTIYPELVPRVAAVVSVAGVIMGSPLADSLSSFGNRLLRRLDVAACDPGDGQGIKSLRRAERLSFLSRVTLPASVRYVSLGAIPMPDEVTPLLRSGWERLASIDPLNDGQVFSSDAVIPGSLLAGFVRADHWAVALPFSRTSPKLAATVIRHNEFPREILLESLIRLVEESL
jgi:pimeloyl-ACP methyl ester carboxylesterase